MRCAELEPLIEAIDDGSHQLSAEDQAHVTTCAVCAGRLARARDIERWLQMREVPQPPASFTAAVMARTVDAKWRTERAFDIGFNLAVAAGLLVILAGAAGVAWRLGYVAIDPSAIALLQAASAQVEGRIVSQLQTVAAAAGLLTMALGLWWWAETAAD